MPTSPASRSSGRLFIGVLLAVAALLLSIVLWQLLRTRPRRAASTAEPADEAVALASRPVPPAWTPPAAEPEDRPPEAPIIDEVTVEKEEVCAGEENLVTIKAHTPAGRDDAFLHYFVGTSTGRAVPLRLSAPFGSGLPDPQVRVFGRNNVTTSVPVPRYRVKECEDVRILLVQARQVPNSTEEMEVEATLRDLSVARKPLRITSYRWTFGDGSARVVTTQPAVTHRFRPSDPDAMFSQFLIRCEAVAADGTIVVGRASFQRLNPEFEELHYKKTLVLSAMFTPQFPQLDAAGKVTQRVRLYHYRSSAVILERVRITYVTPEKDGSSPVEELDASAALGTREIPPGDGLETPFTLDTGAHPSATMVDYDFEGHMADGTPAIAHFSVMRPPAAPTPENGARVTDPLLTQKILRARARLGKALVNDLDLARLEREGAFADLRVATTEPEAADAPEAASN